MKNKTQCPHCGSIFTIETNETFDYITWIAIKCECLNCHNNFYKLTIKGEQR